MAELNIEQLSQIAIKEHTKRLTQSFKERNINEIMRCIHLIKQDSLTLTLGFVKANEEDISPPIVGNISRSDDRSYIDESQFGLDSSRVSGMEQYLTGFSSSSEEERLP